MAERRDGEAHEEAPDAAEQIPARGREAWPGASASRFRSADRDGGALNVPVLCEVSWDWIWSAGGRRERSCARTEMH